MTSQAQAQAPLPSVRGLVFLGYPLHPANNPSTERAQHLTAVHIPMLFVQGTRDALADPQLLVSTVGALGPTAALKLLDHADHSFHVPVRSGKTDTGVLAESLDEVLAWMTAVIAKPG
jgi:predicted alpha/beta-hydrolase family hydrolase